MTSIIILLKDYFVDKIIFIKRDNTFLDSNNVDPKLKVKTKVKNIKQVTTTFRNVSHGEQKPYQTFGARGSIKHVETLHKKVGGLTRGKQIEKRGKRHPKRVKCVPE